MRRFLKSLRCAVRGLALSVARGRNAQIQVAAAGLTIVGGWILRLTRAEWLAVILCIGLVLVAETFNSALEELANEVSQEHRERLGRSKDMAAGAVLCAAVVALIVAVVIVQARI